MTGWDIAAARRTYNLAHWGEGYFDVDERGHLVVRPLGPEGPALDLHALACSLRGEGLALPVLLRFPDILRHRLATLRRAFAEAMARHGYRGSYTPVYPIKVNQQRSVVEAIAAVPGVGLEAGSKPELTAVLALARPGDGAIVCNGYKDREYVRLALLGTRLGHRVHIVLEKPSELGRVLEEAAALGIEPRLGVRVRLATIGAGKWQNSGGERSKFGLAAHELLDAVETLRRAGRLHWLRLLHFHLGSQIPNIRDIQRGLAEAARFYVELRRRGAPVDCVDVGGGLGVDYEGTRSRSFCSVNYGIGEYAEHVVRTLAAACEAEDLPHPDLITESGRAMTAHHAVLVTQVVDVGRVPEGDGLAAPAPDEPLAIQELWRCLAEGSGRSPVERYHDAVFWLGEAHTLYAHGVLDLPQRARAERIYHAVCAEVRRGLRPAVRSHREILDELNEKLADKYFCNFSLFQSIPDAWAIEQVFPVVPLHRLDEPPTRRGVIEDITCDSDGRIDHYVDEAGVDATLPLHDPGPEPYLLGIFLVGAYQEILGDMHNLFGDTDSVNVELDGAGGYRLVSPRRGDTAADLLRYVGFEPEALRRAYHRQARAAGLAPAEERLLLAELEAGLGGYTYLEE
ncbi:biosynthetic arginine decarboxylase [Inmirania thermothiophila]|uniref:Biosynthetic arginine decarboxylase n=1 Tax=Inmirania thermothiophila TaxID=1750597 RepID=A0A3N1Y710_9GAMM|nr:biosynthetic arginine decarboxylase [Inmirania thermothiophila]ROR34311.1 arginine decarboxylase [Inmirania thermothiophila]